MKTSRKTLPMSIVALLVALAVVGTAFTSWVVTSLRSPKTLWRSCSPPEHETSVVRCAFVVRVRESWRFPFLIKESQYELVIGRDEPEPSYGHATPYGLHLGLVDELTHLSKARGTWDKDGFTFEEPSGHRLFVPRSAYVGGR